MGFIYPAGASGREVIWPPSITGGDTGAVREALKAKSSDLF